MKKSSLHFKIAAWSIKNPNKMYAATGGALLILLLMSAVITGTLMKQPRLSANSTVPVAASTATGVNSFEKANWTIMNRQMIAGRLCVLYRHSSNKTRITSCYVQDGENWVFQQSF